jgi:hypothetical protein
MFVYCIDVHLSEAEAYLRITAARAAREHPVLLHMLADGRLHLTGIAKLVPHSELAWETTRRGPLEPIPKGALRREAAPARWADRR